MRNLKKGLSGLLAVILIACLVPSAFAYEPSDWAKTAVDNAVRLSIISEEYSSKPFNQPISRLDFINLAVNLYATLTAEDVSTNPKDPFTDTDNIFANMAYYIGIVSGDGEGHFNPINPNGTPRTELTRQELCKIVTSLLDSAGVLRPYFPTETVFDNITDADDIASWAKNHVAFMIDFNIMAGDEVGTFRPNDNVTREEAAAIVYRCYFNFGKNYDGQIKTTVRQTTDAGKNVISILSKTIVLPSGATVALRYASNPDDASSNPTLAGSNQTAPSGTPLQLPDSNGLYRLKTYTETLATGEAAEKEARIFPDGNKYTSKEEADANMSEVTVNVWKLNENGEKYASTLTFKINTKLKEDVMLIFDEIFYSDDSVVIVDGKETKSEGKPVIKDAIAYGWRNSMTSGLYSDHNYGTAIDLNYNENYTRYANGMTIGSFYDPDESIYSFRPEGKVVQTFAKYGWLWGGNAWVNGTVDYMHFTYLGK